MTEERRKQQRKIARADLEGGAGGGEGLKLKMANIGKKLMESVRV